MLRTFLRRQLPKLCRTSRLFSAQANNEIPGFREPGVVATDYEIATGTERYELLEKLEGRDPWYIMSV